MYDPRTCVNLTPNQHRMMIKDDQLARLLSDRYAQTLLPCAHASSTCNLDAELDEGVASDRTEDCHGISARDLSQGLVTAGTGTMASDTHNDKQLILEALCEPWF